MTEGAAGLGTTAIEVAIHALEARDEPDRLWVEARAELAALTGRVAALVETRARQLFAEHYCNMGGTPWDECWRLLPEEDRRHWRALAAAWVAGRDLGALVVGGAEEVADGGATG